MTRKGLLLRVGIDQIYGKYNAPINPVTNDYLYMPIPQGNHTFLKGMATGYNQIVPFFGTWAKNNSFSGVFPNNLKNRNCHLDPDFDCLTYGDQGTGRGNRVKKLKQGDFLVFFASFKPITPCNHRLIYAIFGFMVVDKVIQVKHIQPSDFHLNAHTRITNPNGDHIVIFADKEKSGRLKYAIPIGEYRDKSYRVTNDMLKDWGGLDVKNGFIQRSVNPPWFNDSGKFLSWLDVEMKKTGNQLIANNW